MTAGSRTECALGATPAERDKRAIETIRLALGLTFY